MQTEADLTTEPIPSQYKVQGSKPVIGLIADGSSILNSKMQTLVCPVNCKGVMGAGLAKQFAMFYPDLPDQYVKACREGRIKIGEPMLFIDSDERQIIAFPTKNDWQNDSKFWYITSGLEFLVKHKEEMNIKSIAFPALGCGLGKLNKKNVLKVIEDACGKLNIDCEIYA